MSKRSEQPRRVPGRTAARAERQERLAKALRDNLRRRRQQRQAREEPGGDGRKPR